MTVLYVLVTHCNAMSGERVKNRIHEDDHFLVETCSTTAILQLIYFDGVCA
jgi:hypothetical protein